MSSRFGSSDSGTSSRKLEEVLKNSSFWMSDWATRVPMWTVIEVLWHFPKLRDLIRDFRKLFLEGENLLPKENDIITKEHEWYVWAKEKRMMIENGSIWEYTVSRFVSDFYLYDEDERAVKVWALVVLLPHLNEFYTPITNFADAFSSRTEGASAVVLNKEPTEQDYKLKTRYNDIETAYNNIRNLPIDNSVDVQLLDC